MVNTNLSEYEINILKEFIGNCLICFRSQEIDKWGNVYGNLEIVSTNKRIEIRNEQKPIKFFEGIEDVAQFSIIENNSNKGFEPIVLDTLIFDYTLEEKVINISIITDDIKVFSDSNKLIYEISIDRAIIFHLEKQILTFSKGWYFDENISIIKGEIYEDKIRSIDQIKIDWLDPEIEKGYVKCIRNEKKLRNL